MILKPDLIAITGDLADGSVSDLQNDVAPLADLKAQLGTYFVTGNHDYYSGADAWCAHAAKLGLCVLRNERVPLTLGIESETIDLAGVEDMTGYHFPNSAPDMAKALRDRNANTPVILLAHQPSAIFEAAKFDVDLQLSGHTHGGQIWPFNYLIYLQQPYIKGLHRHPESKTQIYVNSGNRYMGATHAACLHVGDHINYAEKSLKREAVLKC